MDTIREFLRQLIQPNIEAQAASWLDDQIETIGKSSKPLSFYLAFGSATRYMNKEPIHLSTDNRARAEKLRSGFDPSHWTVEQACRTILLLSLPRDQQFFHSTMENLFDTADISEQAALFKSFAVIPFPEQFVSRASEGIRTNMVPVFDSIALNNPYPADYLDEDPWNQMVLKAAFMDRPIYRISGIQSRANADLAKIISDYAHERWAAGRIVSPEFWRPVGKFVDNNLLSDIAHLLEQDDRIQHDAAALVCHESENPEARELLVGLKDQVARIEAGTLNWNILAHDWWDRKG